MYIPSTRFHSILIQLLRRYVPFMMVDHLSELGIHQQCYSWLIRSLEVPEINH